MTPWLDDGDVRLYHGDALDVLRGLPDGSVDCCVTSPPYLGLRDYGDPKQIGLETTIDEYVQALVAVFSEVGRVLKDTGTLWLNLGDSYNAYNGGAGPSSAISQRQSIARPRLASGFGLQQKELKPKDLMMVPARVALALQADGWWLRSEIVWAKRNAMPESVTDRPTKSHEMVYLLAKCERYYFGQDELREPYQPSSIERDAYGYGHAFASQFRGSPTDERHPNGKELPPGSFAKGPDGRRRTEITPGPGSHDDYQTGTRERWPDLRGRNVRDVWHIATEPYPEGHFAVFPQELARRCVIGGCPPGGTVLDPFMGSGTVAKVARDHQRHAIGIDLNEQYLELAARRLQQLSLLNEARA